MHLSRLEIYGFKSFADDTRIELPPGLTVLVGPNGGGKSNVVDAIRWALGEQRVKELRAERWEDLLFAGSGRRPPAQMAEVFLEFDNRDGRIPDWPEHLRVGRRLFRSGDSEYLLDNRVVRLKDITDLFLDSGLGRAAYAIIGQGKVEAALLMRPAERLEQLEEAAGTTRYKVRRRETLQHLDAATKELERVADLIGEVTRERDRVAEDAQRERAYLVRERERQELKRGFLAARREELAARLADLERTVADWQVERGRLDEELRKVQDAIQAVSATLPEDQAVLDELTRESLERERERERWRGRLDGLVREADDLARALAETEAELMALDQAASEAEGPLAAADDPRPSLREELAAARARVEQLRQAEAAARTARDEARLRVQALADMLRTLQQLDEQLQVLTGKAAESPERLRDEVRRAAEAARERVMALDAEIRLVREQADRLGQYLGQEQERREVIHHQLAQRQARLRVLQQLEAEGEGYGHGVRAVLKASADGHLTGIYGTLGSLIETDDRFVVALQAAMGGAAQDIVTDSERVARQAVRYLQSRGLGRATFLPLDTVRPQVPQPADRDLHRQEGAVGWVMSLIRLPERVTVAAQHVLGRVLVAETLEDAVRIGRLVGFRYRIVTLDGQLVQPGGAITGGSPAPHNATWVRRQEIDRLTKDLERERRQLEGLDQLLAGSRRELGELEGRLQALQTERVAAQHELAEAAYVHTQMERVLATVDVSADAGTVATEHQQALDTLRQAEATHLAHEQALREAEHEITRLDATLRRVEEDWALRDALQQAREERRADVARRRQELADRIARIAGAIRENRARQDEAEEAIAAAEGALRDVNEQVALLRQARADAEADLAVLRDRARSLELELRRGEHRVEAAANEMRERRREWEALVHDPDAAGTPVANVREARHRIQVLEQELAALGPVSSGSLAMYEALTARAEFLERERQDVERAVLDLSATLKELDQEVAARRNEAATAVEAAFREAVTELFGGGNGGFRFVDDPEPGLELWVEPPGKRPQSLGLLSGGEKALGALAWLFALLAVRPAPLVVLDEVEASLDELNARRFAQYLARRRHSQYVVVSHHKPTMEQADALWGFTSDARGVTRLVSVRLQELDE
jgi:chromosome segregation protein